MSFEHLTTVKERIKKTEKKTIPKREAYRDTSTLREQLCTQVY